MRPLRQVSLGLIIALAASGADLLQELKSRSESEGLALVRLQDNWFYLLQFDDHMDGMHNPGDRANGWEYLGDRFYGRKNPREISGAFFSSDGNAVVWELVLPRPRVPYCWPAVVEMRDAPGSRQLPGNVTGAYAMAVSSDGREVAFDATYLPEHSPPSSAVTGLHFIDPKTSAAKLIVPVAQGQPRVTSISFSPDGTRFVYGYQGSVYLYDLGAGSPRRIAAGDNPTWSPNGKWVAFRSEKGIASVLEAATFQPIELIARRKIEHGVHWSPDSQYIAVAEHVGIIANLLHWRDPLFGPDSQLVVERISDHATSVLAFFNFDGGIDDRGFYWTPNYRAFLQNASHFPQVKDCGKQR
jgi:WD40 repeat protein